MQKKKVFLLAILLITILMCPTTKLNVLALQENLEEFSQQIEEIQSYSYIDTFCNNILLTSTNDILYVTNNSKTKFENEDLETGIYLPKFALKTNNNIIVIDGLNRIQIYDNEFHYIKTFNYVEAENKYNIGNIVCVTKDYAGNLYFVDATANKILFLNNTLTTVTEANLDLQINIDNQTKIFINANGNLLAIKSQNSVFIYDITTNSTLANFDANVEELYFDYQNNLFVLYQNSISKYDKLDYSLTDTKNFIVDIKSASIDIETGKFYFLSNKIYTFSDVEFAQNASYEVQPISIQTTQLLQEQVQFAKASNNCLLYATCVSFSSNDEILENQLIMILKKDIKQNNNMWYCLANINGVEKQGYIQKSNLNVLKNEEQNITYKTICKNVKLKTYPSNNAGISNIILEENTELCVLGTAHDFVDSSNKSYFVIKTNNGVAYIEQNFLTELTKFESELKEIEPIDNGQTKFIAYVLTTLSLIIVTIFVCIIIGRRKNNKVN